MLLVAGPGIDISFLIRFAHKNVLARLIHFDIMGNQSEFRPFNFWTQIRKRTDTRPVLFCICCGARNRTGVWRLCVPLQLSLRLNAFASPLGSGLYLHLSFVSEDVCHLVSTPSLIHFRERAWLGIAMHFCEGFTEFDRYSIQHFYRMSPIEAPRKIVSHTILPSSSTSSWEMMIIRAC